ncbi:MAG: hypothetical protein M1816_008259 [Peltula sp. TS41687]|nr:MAG: hypothetical protein M1816_008259 [Peltula sp. TS41687]
MPDLFLDICAAPVHLQTRHALSEILFSGTLSLKPIKTKVVTQLQPDKAKSVAPRSRVQRRQPRYCFYHEERVSEMFAGDRTKLIEQTTKINDLETRVNGLATAYSGVTEAGLSLFRTNTVVAFVERPSQERTGNNKEQGKSANHDPTRWAHVAAAMRREDLERCGVLYVRRKYLRLALRQFSQIAVRRNEAAHESEEAFAALLTDIMHDGLLRVGRGRKPVMRLRLMYGRRGKVLRAAGGFQSPTRVRCRKISIYISAWLEKRRPSQVDDKIYYGRLPTTFTAPTTIGKQPEGPDELPKS